MNHTSNTLSSSSTFTVTPFSDSGEGAIAWDYSGKEICRIPSTINRVGLGFARDNKNLEEVVMEDGIVSISPDAFKGCSNLKKVTLPTTLREMPRSAFDDLDMVIKQNSFLQVEGGVLYNPITQCALCCIGEEREEYSIKEGTFLMGWNCFGGNSTVKKVILPSSLKRILGGCFMGCEKLKEIQLPEGIEYIGSCAFFLTSITTLSIPESCEVENLALLNNPNEIVRQ